jgi:hypothetical protein
VKVALAALVGSLALAAGAVDDACACSCVAPDADAYLERFDGAFIGRLVEKREVDRGGIWRTIDPAVYVFRVEAVAKGDLPQTLHVISAVSGASCGLEVPKDERIGLFLEREGGEWRSSLCLQVAAADLEQAAEDAGFDLRQPLAGTNGTDDGGSSTGPLLLAAGAGVFLLALGLVLLRRWRSGSAPAAA